eukprot:CAMPEP_0204280118 /NCGR_PEP_ID=MMETSP0468-20130131/37225_1 /ASSEMBLY_ACC=CAM_ASM_000383 /TAXON_ID=2969 /ORGANISM="Oxyrrhis marina" /LENGTH=94 /DNA_ID=CAMNT_0051257293 /DNA_START=197 /DNA_END=481 /DNA_ORIENTATION=+
MVVAVAPNCFASAGATPPGWTATASATGFLMNGFHPCLPIVSDANLEVSALKMMSGSSAIIAVGFGGANGFSFFCSTPSGAFWEVCIRNATRSQ